MDAADLSLFSLSFGELHMIHFQVLLIEDDVGTMEGLSNPEG